MTVVAAFLRAVNVGGHNALPMAPLVALCAELGLARTRHHLQSGNLVFVAKGPLDSLGARLEEAILARFGFRPLVLLRTLAELRGIVADSPFAGREISPEKRVVLLLPEAPTEGARLAFERGHAGVEEGHFRGRELHLFFPNGQGKSKLTPAWLERTLGLPGTARNWNTISKVLALGEGLAD
jgi:uncharacterized protein (DUF1697 family)